MAENMDIEATRIAGIRDIVPPRGDVPRPDSAWILSHFATKPPKQDGKARQYGSVFTAPLFPGKLELS